MNQYLRPLSIIIAPFYPNSGHHYPYTWESVVNHVPESLRLSSIVLDADEELPFVFESADL